MPKSKFVIVRDAQKVEKLNLTELSNYFLEYAILSSNAYANSIDDPSYIMLDSWKAFAQDSLPVIPQPRFKSQIIIRGLKYQVWHKKNNSKIIVAIVFKGTTFTFMNDWICNLRWVTMNPILKHFFNIFLWDYYHQVQVLTPLIIKQIKEELGNNPVEFVSTGHSLGGGLAQQAAYSTDFIKEVIVFNPSPVTGYKDVKKEIRLINAVGINISRVFHKGEVLAYLRNFIREFILPLSDQNPSIKEYQFSFFKGSALKRHNIREFANYLIEVSKV